MRLIERIQRGESELVGVLYGRYFDPLYGYLRSILERSADAEDVAQQAFAAAIEALPVYEIREVASFRSWLFRIARNCAVDHQRKHGHVDLTAPHAMAEQMAHLRSDSDDPDRGLSWLSDTELATALRRLPGLAREVVLLRYVGDFGLGEIAGIVGVSEDSVKQAHRRALKALRERLGVLPGYGTTGGPLAMRQLPRPSARMWGHSFSPAPLIAR